MLEPDIRALAVKIANRLIINIAKHIANTGYRSGKLKLMKGITDGNEIEQDRSLENYMESPEVGILKNIVSYFK